MLFFLFDKVSKWQCHWQCQIDKCVQKWSYSKMVYGLEEGRHILLESYSPPQICKQAHSPPSFICENGLANSPDAHPPPPPPNCSQSLHPIPLPFCPLPNLPLSRQRRKKKLFFTFPDERSPLKVAPSSSSPAKKHLERKSGKGKEEEEASLRKRKRSMGRCGIRHCFCRKKKVFLIFASREYAECTTS